MRTVSRFSKSTPSRCSIKVVTKCWRVCSPSLIRSIPACNCSCKDKRSASFLPSTRSSPSSLQGDQSFSGSASQEGLGKLPAVEVGSNFFIINNLVVFDESKRVNGCPLIKNNFVWLDKTFFGKPALLNRQTATFFTIIDNLRNRMIRIFQARLIAHSCCRIGIVNLGAVDFLECLHRADGTDQFQIRVVTEQITTEVKSQRRHAIWGHEITNLQAHFREVLIGRRELILLVFDAQYRMLI